MSAPRWALLLLLFGSSAACKEEPPPHDDRPARGLPDKASPRAPSSAAEATPPRHDAARPTPFVPGDPHGLLSRKRATAQPTGAADVGQLDPGALMAGPKTARSSAQAPTTEPEVPPGARDALSSPAPKPAEARYLNAAVRDTTITAVVNRVRAGSSRARVLFLYGAYCPACRKAMPRFIDIVRSHGRRSVEFTAGSVDRDRDAFVRYVPALEGMVEPLWIRAEGKTTSELKRLGLPLKDTFSVPLVAVLDRSQRVVLQGNGSALYELPRVIEQLAD